MRYVSAGRSIPVLFLSTALIHQSKHNTLHHTKTEDWLLGTNFTLCPLSFRLCSLYSRTTVLEVRSSWHELFGGLSALHWYGFFQLQKCMILWPVENQIRFSFFPFFFFTMKRSFWNRDILMFKEMKQFPLTLFFYSIYWYSDQFHLLRKTKVCFCRLGTSCAAISIFILHICPHIAEIWDQC